MFDFQHAFDEYQKWLDKNLCFLHDNPSNPHGSYVCSQECAEQLAANLASQQLETDDFRNGQLNSGLQPANFSSLLTTTKRPRPIP